MGTKSNCYPSLNPTHRCQCWPSIWFSDNTVAGLFIILLIINFRAKFTPSDHPVSLSISHSPSETNGPANFCGHMCKQDLHCQHSSFENHNVLVIDSLPIRICFRQYLWDVAKSMGINDIFPIPLNRSGVFSQTPHPHQHITLTPWHRSNFHFHCAFVFHHSNRIPTGNRKQYFWHSTIIKGNIWDYSIDIRFWV